MASYTVSALIFMQLFTFSKISNTGGGNDLGTRPGHGYFSTEKKFQCVSPGHSAAVVQLLAKGEDVVVPSVG